jgi:hypothetical protein
MIDDSHLRQGLVKGNMIAEQVPFNLSALQILCRRTVGSTVRICAVGDIGLSGRAEITARRWGTDSLIAEVAPLFRATDIVFGNLEFPLTSEMVPGEMFSAPVGGAETLHKAGFNLMHLANNHVGEYGQIGLVATLGAVRKAGMIPLGAGQNLEAAKRLIRTDVRGLRIGWLGCGRTQMPQDDAGPRYWEFDEEELMAAVMQARPKLDLLIVSIHIGYMYIDYPRPQHKMMAERLMAAGADLILMHHAHVLQGVQVTSENRVSCYNLGNFLLDWCEGNVKTPIMIKEQNEGAVFLFVLDRQGIAQAVALPTWIDDDCKVRWAVGAHGEQILERLVRISRDLEGDFAPVFESQRAERNTGGILKVLWFHIRHGNWMFVLQSLRRVRLEHLSMGIRWLGRVLKRLANGAIP